MGMCSEEVLAPSAHSEEVLPWGCLLRRFWVPRARSEEVLPWGRVLRRFCFGFALGMRSEEVLAPRVRFEEVLPRGRVLKRFWPRGRVLKRFLTSGTCSLRGRTLPFGSGGLDAPPRKHQSGHFESFWGLQGHPWTRNIAKNTWWEQSF